jgi:hypothetical protein
MEINNIIKERKMGKEQYKKVSKKIRKKIKNDYKKGITIDVITKKYNITLGVAWYIVKKVAEIKRNKEIENFKNRLNNLSEFDIGYLIGIIDGEGSLNITQEKERYRVSISISNCDKKIINWIKNKLRANILKNRLHIFRNKTYQMKNWTKIYEWKLSDKKLLLPLLLLIKNRAVGKSKEITFMIDFLNTKCIDTKKKIISNFRKEKATKNKRVKLIENN